MATGGKSSCTEILPLLFWTTFPALILTPAPNQAKFNFFLATGRLLMYCSSSRLGNKTCTSSIHLCKARLSCLQTFFLALDTAKNNQSCSLSLLTVFALNIATDWKELWSCFKFLLGDSQSSWASSLCTWWTKRLSCTVTGTRRALSAKAQPWTLKLIWSCIRLCQLGRRVTAALSSHE